MGNDQQETLSRYFDELTKVAKNCYNKQIQRIVVPRFRCLIVWGAIIMILYQ